MKANEFVKKFGWGEAIKTVKASNHIGIDESIVDIGELKRLVESHELVVFCGGLDIAKELDSDFCGDNFNDIQKAIADVESCQ